MVEVRKPRRRGSRTDPDIARAARSLAASGDQWSAAGIHRKLLEEHPEWTARMPEVRTIQNLVRGLLGDEGEPWSFSDGEQDAEDAGVVLTVVRELWDAGIWPRSVTTSEAGYIVRLRRAFPDLPAVTTFELTRAYLSATDRSNIYTLAGLDRYLAFAPWRDGARRYIQALAEGDIQEYFGMHADPSDDEVLRIVKQHREKQR